MVRHAKYTWDWRAVKAIRWGQIARYQAWGNLIVFIFSVIMLFVGNNVWETNPFYIPAYAYDASIAAPYNSVSTIPNGEAAIYCWVGMIVAVLVIELGVLHRRHTLTTAIATGVHMILCCMVNFILVLAITEMMKRLFGSLRPNFLSRCLGDGWQNATATFSTTPVVCTQEVAAVVEGRVSFPSGHTSNTQSVAMFAALYTVWGLHFRAADPHSRTALMAGRLSWHQQALREIGYGVTVVFLAALLFTPWLIGVTRIWDGQHRPVDIVGGIVLGTVFAIIMFGLAIAQHDAWAAAMDDLAVKHGAKVSVLPTAGEGDVELAHTSTTPAGAVPAAAGDRPRCGTCGGMKREPSSVAPET